MKPYIVVPVEWLNDHIGEYSRRIVQYNDKDYYISKIMLLQKMLDEFEILNEDYEPTRKSDSTKLCSMSVAKR